MYIAVDAMGGDFGPKVNVEGAVMAAKEANISIILVGIKSQIEAHLNRLKAKDLPITIHHASQVIEMDDHPVTAMRKKKDSSIHIGLELVKNGEADGMISAGNSGAILALSMLILKKLKGVERPAIATAHPHSKGGSSLLLDAGGNVDCKPYHLFQFAIMGDIFCREIMGIQNPKIGLLSNGEEESKGNELTRRAHIFLNESGLNYIGYVEGMDLYNGKADVIVCDGFVGNVALKCSEGIIVALKSIARHEIKQSLRAKIGYILMKKALTNIFKKVDVEEYGGAPLLGINGVVYICHGNSSPRAIKNAIINAARSIEKRINQQMAESLEEGKELEKMIGKSIWVQIKEKIKS